MVLRRFRDRWLLQSAWGREFVRFYYARSPRIAAAIDGNPAARMLVRVCLKPLVAIARVLNG